MSSVASPAQQLPLLIIDTNAFLKLFNLNELAQKYRIATSNGVLGEVRDKRAREQLDALAFGLQIVNSSENALKFTKKFALATGDLASLSAVDLDLLAVAYTLAEREGKVQQLRREPLPARERWAPLAEQSCDNDDSGDTTAADSEASEWISVVSKKRTHLQGEAQILVQSDREIVAAVPEKQQTAEDGSAQSNRKRRKQKYLANENVDEGVQPSNNDTTQVQNAPEAEKTEAQQESKDRPEDVLVQIPASEQEEQVLEEEEDDDDDDDVSAEGWINARNIDTYLAKSQNFDEKSQAFGIFLMTADYAMQNVALQMGVPVLSPDGMLVRRTKRFVLECYACHRLCRDVTKKFCPECGNSSLLKVSCSVTAEGELILYRKKDFQVNTKGFIFSIPKPITGRNHRHQDHLILREDELLIGGKQHLLRQQEEALAKGRNSFAQGGTDDCTFDDSVNNKKKRPAASKIILPYTKINPASIFHKKSQNKKK